MIQELVRAVLSSFFATMGFGVLLQAPKKSILWGALIGMLGYALYWCLGQFSATGQMAMFFAAAFASILGQIAARRMRMAATVFSTLSIIPLVPGLALYRGMSYYAAGMSDAGGETLWAAMVDILMIALGLAVGAFVLRVFYATKSKGENKKKVV